MLRLLRRRRAVFARGRERLRDTRHGGWRRLGVPLCGEDPALTPRGYDPELLYVECGRCGAPVIWDAGRATRLLEAAGIDRLELDASCLLVTNACPMCAAAGRGNGAEAGSEAGHGAGAAATSGQAEDDGYVVRVFRVSAEPEIFAPPRVGHA